MASIWAGSFTVQASTWMPRACASFTWAASRSPKKLLQILPPAARTIFGTDPWSASAKPAVQGVAGPRPTLSSQRWRAVR